jgi:hypothetical protein
MTTHDAACDGNVDAVTEAAEAEIAKTKLLQSELLETVNSLSTENAGVVKEVARKLIEKRGASLATGEACAVANRKTCGERAPNTARMFIDVRL